MRRNVLNFFALSIVLMVLGSDGSQGPNSDPETGRKIPFFDEIDAVFKEGAQSSQRAQKLAVSKKRSKSTSREQSDKIFSEEELEDDDDEEEPVGSKRQKAEEPDKKQTRAVTDGDEVTRVLTSIKEMLKEFMQKQQIAEANYIEMYKKRAEERNAREQEWREKLISIERERLAMYQAWKFRDEQRKIIEERRAELRDEILRLLMNRMNP